MTYTLWAEKNGKHVLLSQGEGNPRSDRTCLPLLRIEAAGVVEADAAAMRFVQERMGWPRRL